MTDESPASLMPPQLQPASGADQIERADKIRPPRPDEALSAILSRDGRGIWVESLTLAIVAALALGWIGVAYLYRPVTNRHPPIDEVAIKAVVERIITVESNGDPNTKNKRSSATGAGQFLDDTWLEMIRTHRRDLVHGRSKKEVLELRRDPELAREIVTRLVEQNATMLTKRGLPVTLGTLSLTYFAGPAGAVAILPVSENADAASLMASADATGRTTREKLVNANPFLKALTVGDLKNWADRKMSSY